MESTRRDRTEESLGEMILKQSRLTYSKFEPKGQAVLESCEKILVTDLIGEGPIDGVVDKNGNDVSPKKIYNNNDNIYKGIYYNDLPILDSDSDLYNFNLIDSSLKFGYGIQEPLYDKEAFEGPISNSEFNYTNAAVAYGYEKPLYPIQNPGINMIYDFPIGARSHASWILTDTKFKAYEGSGEPLYNTYTPTFVRDKFSKLFTKANFSQSFGITHEVRDRNTKFLICGFQVDRSYRTTKKGDTRRMVSRIGISIGYKGERERVFILHAIGGICTSAYKQDIYLDISDFDMSRIPVVRIYNFSEKIPQSDTKQNRALQFVNLTEMQGCTFTYPYSAYGFHQIDARSQSQIPNRSYDLKLTKVKVPINYDSEAKVYHGTWNGEFDPVLRWTDNPAWILYDIITNQRYGIGKFTKEFSFLNKWSAYEIAKFCDGLVPTKLESKFPAVKIVDIAGRENDLNTVDINNTTGYRSGELFPTGTGLRKICLINLKFYDPDTGGYYFKSFEGYYVGPASGGGLKIAKKMSSTKMFSSFDGIYDLVDNLSEKTILNQMYHLYSSGSGFDNTTPAGKFNAFVKGFANTSKLTFLDNEDVGFFTREEKQYYIPNSGTAVIVFDDENYPDLLESRFNCNIYLQNDTQVYDLINNIASVFRGVAYWNNFQINFSADKKADPVYSFTNANVKSGLFNYSGSAKDNRYTVCKVVYSDKTDNYRDKTIYVEDYTGIREYGYIEREIMGFGITSEAQARRIGRWFLLTNQVERDVVTFIAGQETNLLSVGDIINVSDEFKLSAPRAGRIHSVSRDDYILTLDNKYDFISANDKITVQVVFQDIEEIKIKSSDTEQSSLLYTFVVDEVEVVSSDDDFRTQITLIVDDTAKRKMFGQITPNSLWFFEEKYQSDIDYKREYRIISIKEGSNGEFEVVASEYNKSKFDYIESDSPLDIPALVDDSSNAELQKTDFIPKDLLSSINESTFYDGSEEAESSPLNQLLIALIGTDEKGGFKQSYTPNYDYIFEAENIVKGDYTNTFYSATFSLNTFYDKCLDSSFGPVITADEDNQTIGLLVSMSLCGKRVSFRWLKNDTKTSYTIVYPQKFFNDSAVDITVYKIGRDYQLLP